MQAVNVTAGRKVSARRTIPVAKTERRKIGATRRSNETCAANNSASRRARARASAQNHRTSPLVLLVRRVPRPTEDHRTSPLLLVRRPFGSLRSCGFGQLRLRVKTHDACTAVGGAVDAPSGGNMGGKQAEGHREQSRRQTEIQIVSKQAESGGKLLEKGADGP